MSKKSGATVGVKVRGERHSSERQRDTGRGPLRPQQGSVLDKERGGLISSKVDWRKDLDGPQEPAASKKFLIDNQEKKGSCDPPMGWPLPPGKGPADAEGPRNEKEGAWCMMLKS